MWHVIAAYDIFLDELLDLLRCDGGQRFGFYPLSEVVVAHNEEFYLSISQGEGAEDVHSPFRK